jgi:membrane protease YdiL (CAAX protease family)
MVLSIAAPLFCEPKKNEEFDSSGRIFGKAILAGASIYIVFGPAIAGIAVIVHLALSYITLDRGNTAWFSSDVAGNQIKKTLQSFAAPVLIGNGIWGIMEKTFKRGSARQISLQILLQTFYQSPMKFLRVFFVISCLAPVVEEVVFRGFLQEKIRDIQTIFFKERAQQTISKITRVVIQALLFAVCHFEPLLKWANLYIILITFCLGVQLGITKEKEKNIWACMTLHGLLNTVVCLRVVLIGG